jgi:hypothetical protein
VSSLDAFARPGLRRAGALAAAATLLFAFGAGAVSAAGPGPRISAMDAQGIVHPHGHAKPARPKASPNLVYHNGQIMTSSVVQAIYWGGGWSSPGDKISGLAKLYGGLGGSSYMNTNTEYTGTNGTVGNGVSFGGSLIDLTAAPKSAPSTSTVLAEVAKMVSTPVANGYYPVYSDQKRGNAGYCAWHSYGTINGVPVQFGFFFNLDGDPGCDPADTTTGHSQGLAALANVTGHEIEEARTDPASPGAWYDQQGAENGDKCAWTFNVPSVTFSDGNQWKIQGEWSNAAYTGGTGYPNSSGQRGCVDGH